MNFSIKLKNYLHSLLDDMNLHPELYSVNPSKNFSRTKKWSLKDTILFILSMENHSTQKEIARFFNYDSDYPTASSFVQRRAQICSDAFEKIFHSLNAFDDKSKTTNDFRAVAIDGSTSIIPNNPCDERTASKSGNCKTSFNSIHLSSIYDLNSRLYLDALIQPIHEMNEHLAAQQMIDRYDGPKNTIFIMDRGYECYNTIAHIEQRGLFYIIRGKDVNSSGIASSLKHQLSSDETFDCMTSCFLSNRKTSLVKKQPETYKRIRSNQSFDFFTDKQPYYPLNIRIVRIPISEDSYEILLTNLPAETFPADKLKEFYHMRWGIETSYRELKYCVGLNGYHSKKYDFIIQEIWAKLIVYNFCEMIITRVAIAKKENTKHKYQLNYSNGIFICKALLNWRTQKFPTDVEKLISRELLPVRHNRSYSRKVKSRSAVSLVYRLY